jgi:CRP-like cAMP-binding protein
VLAGAEHSVDVVARTDLTLLRLSKQAYDTYLSQLTDVSDRLSRDALGQVVQVDQSRRRHRAEGGCGCEDGCCCTPGHEPEERR